MVSHDMIDRLREFFGDEEISTSWMMAHTEVTIDEHTKTVTIEIDNMNEQEFYWIANSVD